MKDNGWDHVMHFKVLWKKEKDSAPKQEDFITADLKELMMTLKSQGVSPNNVEYLYVHYHPRPRGDVMEMVAVDNRGEDKKNKKLVEKLVENSQKKLDSTKSKPRVRLKNPPVVARKRQLVRQGLYTAELY